MKRMTMKFMALALLMVASSAAVYAQGVAFTTTSLPRQMRQDGITEAAGEIVLTAINAGTILAGSSIDIVYSVAVTNNASPIPPALQNITLANNVSCSPAGFQALCTANMTATLTGTQTIRIAFAANTAFAINDQINISRVRVNASAAVGVGSVTATMSGNSSAPATNPITFTDPQRQVGVLNATITVRFGTTALPVTFFQTCNFPNTAVGAFELRVTEVFPAALTTVLQEQVVSNNQVVTASTIIRVTLSNIPAGITVAGPGANFAGTAGDLSTALILAPSGGSSFDQTIAGTPVIFDYTVVGSNTSLVERIVIPFTIRATSTSTATTLALASIGNSLNVQATVQILPITTSDSQVLRFVPNAIGPTNLVNVADCNTRILMTWVATVFDVETGIAISNTSSDDAAFGSGATSGATAQNGTCTLTGYPTAGGTPVSFTTATINAGSSLPFLLSTTTGFSNFTGYILTVCNFQVGHAFVFITNGRGVVTGPSLAQGYVANVIPGGTRPVVGTTFESLGN